MNLAYKKILGKFTKVLGFGKTPPHVGKNSQIMSFFFLRAYLIFSDLKQFCLKSEICSTFFATAVAALTDYIRNWEYLNFMDVKVRNLAPPGPA